jgi:hypothetical protein
MDKHSLLNLSNKVKHLSVCPLAQASNIKSYAQISLVWPKLNTEKYLLSALTASTVTKYSMPIYFKTSGRPVTLQKTGSQFAMKKDRTCLFADYSLDIAEQGWKTAL